MARSNSNRLVLAAHALLEQVEGKATAELSDLEYLARYGAKLAIKHHETTANWKVDNAEKVRADTRKWVADNPERHAMNTRIAYLRKAVDRLKNKAPAKRGTVDWSARSDAYRQELADLLVTRAEKYGVPESN